MSPTRRDFLARSGAVAGMAVLAPALRATSVPRAALPRGAVAVIVKSPADHTHAYRVRFVDGQERSLRRAEFAVFKAVSARPLRAP